MALDVAGRHRAATAAYRFLLDAQRSDGSFPARFATEAGCTAEHVDTNAVAYLAAGCLHHVVATDDECFAREAFAPVAAAIDYVLRQQREDGAIRWSVDGASDGAALLAASCCAIYLSLGAALELATVVDRRRPMWAERRTTLGRAIRARDMGQFLDKAAFAMDWYYPVLCGALPHAAALRQLRARWGEFVAAAHGVRCRADERWVTSAETAECTLALLRIGESGLARQLFATLSDKRCRGGAYLTGLVYPERSEFPPGETTTYSAAAVLLAADALAAAAATSGLLSRLDRDEHA